MPFLQDLTTKKERMLKEFLSDREVVTLLTDDETHELPAKDLRYKQVFPYAWIDETVDEAKTFICFDVDVPEIATIAVKDCYMYVWIFTHTKIAMTHRGVRVDLLASRIDELINGSTEYGFGKVKLVSALRFMPNSNYYGRVLKYYVQDWNRFGAKL